MENIEKCLICLFDLVSSYLMKTNSTSWQHYVIQPHYFTPLFMQILLIRVCVYSIHLILENFLRILWVLAPFFSFVFGLFCFCFFLFWFVLFCFVLFWLYFVCFVLVFVLFLFLYFILDWGGGGILGLSVDPYHVFDFFPFYFCLFFFLFFLLFSFFWSWYISVSILSFLETIFGAVFLSLKGFCCWRFSGVSKRGRCYGIRAGDVFGAAKGILARWSQPFIGFLDFATLGRVLQDRIEPYNYQGLIGMETFFFWSWKAAWEFLIESIDLNYFSFPFWSRALPFPVRIRKVALIGSNGIELKYWPSRTLALDDSMIEATSDDDDQGPDVVR